MPRERDIAAFEARAKSYELGRLGRLHHEIADHAVALALRTDLDPRRVLDVGCGTGYLLRSLASRCPGADQLVGIDPAQAMIEVAVTSTRDPRVSFSVGVSEHLPHPTGAFDLVVSTTSFDHWADQRSGLGECARVLRPGGHLVLVDQFSPLLAPTMVLGRRGRARTKRRASRLLRAEGFHSLRWHKVYEVIIRGVTATA